MQSGWNASTTLPNLPRKEVLQLEKDRTLLKVTPTEALGPAVSSSAQSSEGSNFNFRNYFDEWSNKGPDACVQVAVTYLYTFLLSKATVKPRTEQDMGGPLKEGETIIERMRSLDGESVFFFT